MSKENLLFCVIGLLAGLIIGFMFANSINQSVPGQATAAVQPGNLPAGHPTIPGGSQGGMQADVQAGIDRAKSEPDNFEAQMKAAELFYQIQRYDNALEYLKKANKIQPDNYEVIVQLGNTNFDAEHYEEAEKWYAAALAKKEDVNVRTDLGLTYVFRPDPDYDRAIKEFKRSLAADPNHVQTLQNLTVVYTKKNDAAAANATLQQLEAIDAANPAIPKLKTDIAQIPAK